MNNKSMKYTFVCDPDECDTMIEVTCPAGFDYPNGVVQLTCPCGRQMSYISATLEIPTREREPMESTTTFLENQATKLQELINNKDVLIERLQDSNTRYSGEASKLNSQVRELKDYLTENYDELEMHADSIAEIFDIELSREITYDVTMTAKITVSVPIGEDGEDILRDNLYIDANHGDVVIDEYEVDSVTEF